MTLRKIKLIFSVNGITIKVKEIIDERYPDAVVRIIDKLNKMASKFIEEKKGFDSC